MLKPFVTALRTLTILPIPGKDTDDYSKSLLYFPFAGGGIALAAYPVFLLCQLIPHELQGVGGLLFTLAILLVTGGLHVDGIADVADGFYGGKSKEMVLKIMKDSRIGTFGGIAIVMDLLFRFVLYGFIITRLTYLPVVLSMVVSRSSQAIVLSSCRYARAEGGTAAPFAGSRSKLPLLVVITAAVYGAFFFYYNPRLLLLPLITVIVAVCGAVWYYYRRIGGITGDCIGSINEIAEIVFLLTWCIA
ncbi:MAG TPA: adenosylcobinamide-GDP ribazoletransferase [Chitinispirillaceae bacterium]|nr:adenosylcobinamide-GDP ribazoletransferase [Chitinispirillaceae bacterium]